MRDLLAAASPPGDSEARHEAELLLGHALGQSRAWLYAHSEHTPDDDTRARFTALIDARGSGQPVAYLLGRRAFWTFDLAVSPAVLIPRPETELLVELALARIARDDACEVADLGTGSGAIALAIAIERPRAHVVATDASAEALAVAAANATTLGLHNVEFVRGDWLDALGTRRFDVIVSNPPYIASGDAHLEQGDLRFEPITALASGVDGFDAIRTIAHGAARHLATNGSLLLEHGWDQAERVRTLLTALAFDGVASARDGAGHERVSWGTSTT